MSASVACWCKKIKVWGGGVTILRSKHLCVSPEQHCQNRLCCNGLKKLDVCISCIIRAFLPIWFCCFLIWWKHSHYTILRLAWNMVTIISQNLVLKRLLSTKTHYLSRNAVKSQFYYINFWRVVKKVLSLIFSWSHCIMFQDS